MMLNRRVPVVAATGTRGGRGATPINAYPDCSITVGIPSFAYGDFAVHFGMEWRKKECSCRLLLSYRRTTKRSVCH